MALAAKKLEAKDVLEQKRKALASYTSQFDKAVSLVTSTIDSLSALDANIQRTIGEIDDYPKELDATKDGLVAAQGKNQRVIDNFKSLLAVE